MRACLPQVALIGLLFAACTDPPQFAPPMLACATSVTPTRGPTNATFDAELTASSGASCTLTIDGASSIPVACNSMLFSSPGSQFGPGPHNLKVTAVKNGMIASCMAAWTVEGTSDALDMQVSPDTGSPPDMAMHPSDMSTPFNLATVQIFASPSDVSTWPVTTTITQLDLQPSGIKFSFSKKATSCTNTPLDPTTTSAGSWPDVPYGAGGSIEYTFWMFELINGTWYGAADLEFWCGLDRYPASPNALATGGFYDGRWGPLANRVPAIGEMVGFMVTQGDSRNNGPSSLKERSNVVFVPFPSDAVGGTFNF